VSPFEAVAVMVCLMGAGFLVQRLGWVDGSATLFISKAVINLALPCYMFWNFLGSYDRPRLLALLPLVPVPALSIFVSLMLGVLIARLVAPPGRRGTLAAMIGFSNTIFIGLPINMLLFGDPGVPYVIVTYIANTTLFWTLGVALIASDDPAAGRRKGIGLAELGRILSPPFLTFLASCTLVILGFKAPKFLLEASRHLGNLVTPLSMLFVGISVAQSSFREIRLDRSAMALVLGRFLLAPAVLLAVVALARSLSGSPLPELAATVFLVQACMPAMAQTGIIARAHGADHAWSARMTVLTTLLSMAVLPVIVLIINSK